MAESEARKPKKPKFLGFLIFEALWEVVQAVGTECGPRTRSKGVERRSAGEPMIREVTPYI